MRLAASLEEAIIRIEERQSEQDIEQTIIRLRVMQGEIFTALRRLEGDFRPDV
jgi:hypothetical protein